MFSRYLASQLPCQLSESRHSCKRTCLQKKQTPVRSKAHHRVFLLIAYLLKTNPAAARPQAIGQTLTSWSLPVPRGNFTCPNPRFSSARAAQPHHAGADTEILRPASRDTTPAEAAAGWCLPPFGKSQHPQTPAAAGSPGAAWTVNGSRLCSHDSSSPLPRPPSASSAEELSKAARRRQPSCSAGMFGRQLLIQCFAYWVSNATCFYMFNVNKGKIIVRPKWRLPNMSY